MQKYYLMIFDDICVDDHMLPAIECFTEAEYEKWSSTITGIINENYENEMLEGLYKPKKIISSYIRFKMGEYTDNIELPDYFFILTTMKEFVTEGYVEVIEVDEPFYNSFHKTRLSRISLCNIFEIFELPN